MTEVNVTKLINVPAKLVWAEIETFRGIENYSPIAKSIVVGQGVGAGRTCYLPDGAEITEKLTVLDQENMYMEYMILTGPFPISNYTGKVKVSANGTNSSSVSWGSSYEVGEEAQAQMEEAFSGIYDAIISGLEEMITEKA